MWIADSSGRIVNAQYDYKQEKAVRAARRAGYRAWAKCNKVKYTVSATAAEVDALIDAAAAAMRDAWLARVERKALVGW